MSVTYYIGTGEKTMMYTLRAQSDESMVVEGERVEFVMDYYIRNLSTDMDKAVATAKNLGYEVSMPEFSLLDIIRQDEERSAAAKAAKELRETELHCARELEQFAMIEAGYWPFGRWAKHTFEETDLGYIAYWLGGEPTEDRVITLIRTVLAIKFPNVVRAIELKNGNGNHFGEVKKRVKGLKGIVIAYFSYETFYGYINVLKIVLDSGELVVYKGATCFDVDVAQEIEFAATVKEHGEYQDINQTMILRLALV